MTLTLVVGLGQGVLQKQWTKSSEYFLVLKDTVFLTAN